MLLFFIGCIVGGLIPSLLYAIGEEALPNSRYDVLRERVDFDIRMMHRRRELARPSSSVDLDETNLEQELPF